MASRPKILMLGWEFPPLINGGLGVACLGMAKALSKHADVSIILPKADPEFEVENVGITGLNNISVSEVQRTFEEYSFETFSESVDRVPVFLDPYYDGTEEFKKETKTEQITQIREFLSQGDLDTFKIGGLYGDDVAYKVIQFAKYAAALAATKDFDIIHAHDWMTFLAGVEIKRLTGKPLAVHVHALQYDRVGVEDKSWIREVETYGMSEADIVMPVSHYTGDICEEHYGVDKDKIAPVHNGADAVEVYHEEKGFPEALVLFLGRITHQKGPETFLEIAAKVAEQEDNVRFVMAGSGDRLKKIIETGAYKQIGDKFHFTGFLDKTKVNSLLAMSDVYCMPSVSEPFGLSALEATQFGIPAVISKQSGVAEVLHSALKADYWDIELMAKHIVDVIQDDKVRKNVVDGGFEDMKSLSWDDAAEKIVDIFNAKLQS